MGWWANFKANRELADARREVARARSPYTIAQFIHKCIDLGKLDIAREEAEKGVEEFPDSDAITEAYKRMIRAKCTEDLKTYRDEVRKSPGPKAYYKLACLYKEMRDLDQAVELARKGVELYPDFEGNYIVLADLRYERFQRDLRSSDGLAAIELFEKAADLNRENYRLLFQLAEIYRAIGAREHAIEKVKLILNFAPDDRNALNLLSQVKELRPSSQEQDLKETLADFERRAQAGALRKQGALTQRYTRNPGQLSRKLSLLDRVRGFQKVVVLGPDGEHLASYPGTEQENAETAETLGKIFAAVVECSLKMDISTFEKGLFESTDGYTYLVMADQLQVAVLCGTDAKKEKIQNGVFYFVEHELYL